MDPDQLRGLIAGVRDGSVSEADAVAALSRLPFADVGDALVDHHRHLRQGAPEAVYGPGKSPEQCVTIVGELLQAGQQPVLATRLDETQTNALKAAFPDATLAGGAMLWRAPIIEGEARVAVVTAGTSDLPVADEALVTLAALGIGGRRIADVGVAGLHRLLAKLEEIRSCEAVIVVAGMEGALASVVGGLTSTPVVAVPTSVGYGSSLEGVTALLSMLSSCASGISVVGIDNGFGAAMAVGRMLHSPSQV